MCRLGMDDAPCRLLTRRSLQQGQLSMGRPAPSDTGGGSDGRLLSAGNRNAFICVKEMEEKGTIEEGEWWLKD